MKKSLFFGLVAILGLFGCTRNQEIEIPDANLSLFARTESPAESRTVVESGVHVYWEPGDEIAVFMGEKAAKFTTDITAASGTATFMGTFGDQGWSEELDLWAVYPFSEDAVFDGETITTTLPSTQVAREGSFGKDMNLSIAHSNSSTLQFYNVGGGIRFSVTEEGIKKVMFEGLSGEIISGKVKIGMDENGKPEVKEVTGGSQFITLLPPSGKEAFEKDTWYYIVAIPGALEGGYKLRFYKDSDYARKVSEKKVVIMRSIFGNLEKADSGIEYEATTTHFPETIEEIRESEKLSLSINTQVNEIFTNAGYYDTKVENLDFQEITSLIQQVDGVLSVRHVTSERIIIVEKKDGTIIHFDYDDTDLDEVLPDDEQENVVSQVRSLLESRNNGKSVTSKKALLLSPFQNSYFVKGQQMGKFNIDDQQIRDILATYGYSLNFLPDKQASLDCFTGDYMADYDLVLIVSHGGGVGDTWFETTVVTGSEIYPESQIDIYQKAWNYSRLGEIPRYAIQPSWLEKTFNGKEFPNSIIYVGSCHSYDVDDLKDVFIRHGAAAYYGFVGEIPYIKNVISISADLMYSVVRSLCRGMDADAAHDFISLDKELWTLWTPFFNLILKKWDTKNFRVNPEAEENPIFLVDPRPKVLKPTVDGNTATLAWNCDYLFKDCKYLLHAGDNNIWYTPSLSQSVAIPFDNPGTYSWSIVTNVYAETMTSDDPEIVATYRTNGEDFTVTEEIHYETPEAIDLGLSVKWASFNLGATKPEELGGYYAWGDSTPLFDYEYSWDSYKWCKGSQNTLTKYCTDPEYGYNGFTDNKTILDLEDDAANIHLKGYWRTPTFGEWVELRDSCSWTWDSNYNGSGICGYKVQSKVPGYTNRSIFIPAAGYPWVQTNGVGLYMSSVIAGYNLPYCFCDYYFTSESLGYGGSHARNQGASIRPVYDTVIHISEVSLNASSLQLTEGTSTTLKATILPSNATDKSVEWTSEDESIATVSSSGVVNAIKPGSTTITVRTKDRGLSASCSVSVKAESVSEIIDLGLSVKWRSFNLGATSPDEYGDYYAWGEISTKDYYDWPNYKWCSDGDMWNLTKYCSTDNKTELAPSDDVAYQKLKGKWRMPTKDEFQELLDNCRWELTSKRGISGFKFTSKKAGYTSKWIFLPLSGLYSTGGRPQENFIGYYYSSTVDGSVAASTFIIRDTTEPSLGGIWRCYGASIRPVYDNK